MLEELQAILMTMMFFLHIQIMVCMFHQLLRQMELSQVLSLVPEADHYRVEIRFPQGLLTNYGHRLPIAYEARATAEIVTDDRRLIERLVAPMRKVFKEGFE